MGNELIIIDYIIAMCTFLLCPFCYEGTMPVCKQPRKVGPCRAAIKRYFYNSKTKNCEEFSWGGCQPNDNNFKSLAECHSTCGGNFFINIYWTKKKGILLVIQPFSVLVESGYIGYEILLTAIFHIGLCNKLQDQSSVKRLSRQWVEFQKVRAGRIFTTKISICFNRRYLYFFPDRKNTKCWTNSYALERNSVQKMLGFVINGCWKKKPRTKSVVSLVNG